jgi:hypothetical protein
MTFKVLPGRTFVEIKSQPSRHRKTFGKILTDISIPALAA